MIIALGYLPFSFFVFNVDRDSLTCFQDPLKGSCAQFETPGLSTTELHPWGRRRTGVGVCGGGASGIPALGSTIRCQATCSCGESLTSLAVH